MPTTFDFSFPACGAAGASAPTDLSLPGHAELLAHGVGTRGGPWVCEVSKGEVLRHRRGNSDGSLPDGSNDLMVAIRASCLLLQPRASLPRTVTRVKLRRNSQSASS